ncbi:MAG: ABC transporter permease subunit [Acidimicrobiales bacterium]|nr:ABC transporter permease subunit [Acidimicrobiales bacterium]
MNTQLRAEFLKQRTTRTAVGMLAALLGLVVSAIAVHAFGLPIHSVGSGSNQLGIFIDVGENLGSLFAALLGAMAITGEIRHGTIRSTLLGTPQRGRVVIAKAVTALVLGIVFGALAAGAAEGAGTLFLSIRNAPLHVTAGDYVLLVAGGAVAASLWAVIGLGVGAIVRSQVPTVVGILVWVLFVENILAGSLPAVGKFAPAAQGRAIAGATNGTVSAPAIGFVLLTLYAVTSVTLGWVATNRRDFA